MQPKLLRVLETRAFRRVGGSREVKVDIRVVAASKRDLRLEVERGKFREDLYFRLAVVTLDLPALRERRDDIPLLAAHLLRSIEAHNSPGDTPLTLPPAVLDTLSAHDWPGNVRELRNVLERAAYLSRAAGYTELSLSAVPLAASAPRSQEVPLVRAATPAEFSFDPGESYRDTRAKWEQRFEVQYVTWLLERHEGNVSAAAREAEMDRKYLHKLAKKHGLK